MPATFLTTYLLSSFTIVLQWRADRRETDKSRDCFGCCPKLYHSRYIPTANRPMDCTVGGAEDVPFTPRQWTSAVTFKASGPFDAGNADLGRAPHKPSLPRAHLHSTGSRAPLLSRAIHRFAPRPRRAPAAAAPCAPVCGLEMHTGAHCPAPARRDAAQRSGDCTADESEAQEAEAGAETGTQRKDTSPSPRAEHGPTQSTDDGQAQALLPEGALAAEQRPSSEYSRKSGASSADTVVQWEVLSDLLDDFDSQDEEVEHHDERTCLWTQAPEKGAAVGCIRINLDKIHREALSFSRHQADTPDTAVISTLGALKLRKCARPWSAGPQLATLEADKHRGLLKPLRPADQHKHERKAAAPELQGDATVGEWRAVGLGVSFGADSSALGALRVGDGCPRAIRSRPATPPQDCPASCPERARGGTQTAFCAGSGFSRASSLTASLTGASFSSASTSSSSCSRAQTWPSASAEEDVRDVRDVRDVLPLAPRDARRKGSMPQYSMRAASASVRGSSVRGHTKAGEEHELGEQGRSEESAPRVLAHCRARPRTGNALLKRLCVEDRADAGDRVVPH